MLRSPCFRYIPSDRSRRPGGVVDFRSMISATVVGTSRLPQSTFADHPESLYLVRIDRIIIQRSRASRCSTDFCSAVRFSKAIIMSRSSSFFHFEDPFLLLSICLVVSSKIIHLGTVTEFKFMSWVGRCRLLRTFRGISCQPSLAMYMYALQIFFHFLWQQARSLFVKILLVTRCISEHHEHFAFLARFAILAFELLVCSLCCWRCCLNIVTVIYVSIQRTFKYATPEIPAVIEELLTCFRREWQKFGYRP